MAGVDPIKQLIVAAGQQQSGRMPSSLRDGFVDIDEHSSADLVRFVKRLAPLINFYDVADAETAAGDWQSFFPFSEQEIAAWLQTRDGQCSPHLALVRCFLELYREPQGLMNKLTGEHLDFYFRRVLRMSPNDPVPDRAHLQLALKKNSGAVLITPAHQFSGGKDAGGVERIYRPVADTVINQGIVTSLRAIYLDPAGNGTVRYAPIANSADGVGAEIEEEEGKWPAFGADHYPAAETGFAIASPVLRMQEGTRRITLTLSVNAPRPERLTTGALRDAFQLYLTGASQWIGPFAVSPNYANGTLTIETTIGDEQEPVVDYDAEVHGYGYDAQTPVLQLLLNTENGDTGYALFADIVLQSVEVAVIVTGMRDLRVVSDLGPLDPAKAFMPFGPQPKTGSRWLIGCPEALNKRLSELTLTLTWLDPPGNMATHYSNYSQSVSNASFTASVTFDDSGGWHYAATGQQLFNTNGPLDQRMLTFSGTGGTTGRTSSRARFANTLNSATAVWARNSLAGFLLAHPVYRAKATRPPAANEGFITVTLEHDFLHETYRSDYVTTVLNFTKGSGTSVTLIKEPYTPVVQSLTLGYEAHTRAVPVSSDAEADFADPDVQFYHLGYFGQMREHGYQRRQFSFLAQPSVTLLPRYLHRGELIVGVEGIRAGDNVSLLLQVAEGSADPDLQREAIEWFVLCDNYWKVLNEEELTTDTTNQLLRSGIVTATIPREATTVNSILPSGPVWLKAAVGPAANVGAVPQLIDVRANAIEVRFVDQGNDPLHLATALPAGTIAKLKSVVGAIKSVVQPYASFGGRMREQTDAFRTRVAERLRHKDRAVTVWDYERLVLEAFPSIHKVKAINHAMPGNWLAPGHVTVITVPDLGNRNAVNPLKPRVDASTLAEIEAYLTDRSGAQVKLHVRNPRYRRVRLAFSVAFRPGFGFNFYSGQLQQRLREVLSPWAFTETADIEFGGTIHKSVLIDFVDELPYVDFITDVRLVSFVDDADNLVDTMQVQPETPDEILVSADQHTILEYVEADAQ